MALVAARGSDWSAKFGVSFRPTHVDETYESLSKTAAALWAKGDRRAIFPDVYGVITRYVGDCLRGERWPAFLEPQWLSRLTGFFAERYFDALSIDLDRREPVSTAWRISFERADSGATFPIQDALLGINAHINYDLAQGLRDNIVLHGTLRNAEKMRRYRRDHDIVNDVLLAAMPEIFRTLAERYDCPVSRAIVGVPAIQTRATQLMLLWLELWRGRVWSELLQLLNNPQPEKRQKILAGTNLRSGIYARALAGPRFILMRANAPAPRQALRMFAELLGTIDVKLVQRIA